MNTQDSEKQTEGFKGITGKAEVDIHDTFARVFVSGVFLCETECEHDSNLIAEAFNVVTETGMTPRQLSTQLTDALVFGTEQSIRAGELQRQNDKMRELLWFWFQKAGHYGDMHVNVQRKAVETEELFLQLKTQDDE